MNKYDPPFSVTNRIIEYVAQISEFVGCVNSTVAIDRNPVLRRKNRILTIQSSLGIEQNSLTVEQVTACLLRAAFSIMNFEVIHPFMDGNAGILRHTGQKKVQRKLP